MALERQKTFRVNVTQPIDILVEDFLKNNEVDPAAVQVVIDGGNGMKTATLTYADRALIKEAYEKQDREYTNADKVTYCHTKDIMVQFGKDLDEEVNKFLSDENIAAISVSRYFSLANQGAFILYIDIKEQEAKVQEKKEEFEAKKKELAEKLAQNAVKDIDANEVNNTVDKYSNLVNNEENKVTVDEHKIETTAGLMQLEETEEKSDANITYTATTATTTTGTVEPEKKEKKSKLFGKNK